MHLADRASAWLRAGAFDEAESDCSKAIAIDPSFTKAYLRLAKARVRASHLCWLNIAEEWFAQVEQGKLGEAESALAAGQQEGGLNVFFVHQARDLIGVIQARRYI